jgi:hypothetical protein
VLKIYYFLLILPSQAQDRHVEADLIDYARRTVHTVKSMSWASGWRWVSSNNSPTKTTTGSKTAVASIAVCGSAKGSPGASLCATNQTTNGSISVDPAVACAEAVNGGAARGAAAAFEVHKRWWAAYWPQSFVSLPITRIEGYYYSQMYRFPSSDRIGLHGLMGAFGPSGMFDLWPDDVWDMNEQVMYWLAAASNRPEIADPMLRYLEGGGA